MTTSPASAPRKLRWRLLRWGLVAMAILITLVAILVTEENWRAKRLWDNYQAAAKARGVVFDWAALVSTNVPDDQNFASASFFTSLRQAFWDEQTQDWKPAGTNHASGPDLYVARPDGSWPVEATGNWSEGRLTNLKAWQNYYRQPSTNGGAPEFPVATQPQTPAADILLALSKYDQAIADLRAAAQRPYARFGGYGQAAGPQGFSLVLRYLAVLKRCTQILELRSLAEMGGHQPAEALNDIQLLLRLDELLRQDPMLIDHLVALAISSITIQPIYEGLAGHCWTDAELAELEERLAATDYLADFHYTMNGERLYALEVLEQERLTRQQQTVMDDGHKSKVVTTSLRWLPAAYFYQNEYNFCRVHEQYLSPLVDATNQLVSPDTLRRNDTAFLADYKSYSPYTSHVRRLASNVAKSVIKFASMQTEINLALTACALERYRLAFHRYPAKLSELEPQFIQHLPHDIIDGQPLRYQLVNADRFVLYSIGWNGKDDGGKAVLNKSNKQAWEDGDYVWKYN